MGYDLYLRDPVTRETLQVPGHLMHGSNIPCEERDGKLVPTTTTEAHLGVTYNYSDYYHDAFPGPDLDGRQYEKDKAHFGILSDEGGIRSLNGLTGALAVPLLQEMIRRIEDRYKDEEGWIETERKKIWYESRKDPKRTKDQTEMFMELLELKRDGLSDDKAKEILDQRWQKKETTVLVSEGNTKDYWQPTAANAIRPLYQLIAFSQLRPDGVWSEES